MPYNIYLSADPFDDVIQISVKNFGFHATMGFILRPCNNGIHTASMQQWDSYCMHATMGFILINARFVIFHNLWIL
jgi:hypothetical protein